MVKYLMMEIEKSQLMKAVHDNNSLVLDLECILSVVDETTDVLERANSSVTTKITIKNPRLNRVPPVGYVSEGQLEIDDKPKGFLPLNLEYKGDFRLSLTLGPDEFETEGDEIIIKTESSEIPSGYRKIPAMGW
ncbi:hypothetical protein ACES2J_16305 [Bdellovibrio bacteriovorus]|uniref:hypothetical protein n=1 Tax=Bdellovibrio bacteriovorus TaxID=959 RepID=UPI0035A5B795